jgi:hypothetical protein
MEFSCHIWNIEILFIPCFSAFSDFPLFFNPPPPGFLEIYHPLKQGKMGKGKTEQIKI